MAQLPKLVNEFIKNQRFNSNPIDNINKIKNDFDRNEIPFINRILINVYVFIRFL